jgi:hypothetical protein
LLGRAAIYAYDYQTNVIPGESAAISVYWRDVGTLEAYYEAHIGSLRACTSPKSSVTNGTKLRFPTVYESAKSRTMGRLLPIMLLRCRSTLRRFCLGGVMSGLLLDYSF